MKLIGSVIILCIALTVHSQGPESKITFYYPGSTPTETISVPDILWKQQGSCISYTYKGEDIVFCGTFRIVKSK